MYKLPTLQELLEAGVHFGHQVRRGHPRMKPYIFGVREGVHVIDLIQSESYLKQACEFVYELGKSGKVLLFVGTKKQARPIIEESAKKLQAPYMAERWMGGFLTNFEEIKKRIKLLKDLKEQKAKGDLSRYTKKEQLLLDREMDKLHKDFVGVMDLATLPDAIFVVDAVTDNIAIREANRLGIKVIAIADSNCNVSEIVYPIPGNDDAIKSIKILVEAIASAYGEGKEEARKAAEKEAKRVQKEALRSRGPQDRGAQGKQVEEDVDKDLAEQVAVVEEQVEKQAIKEAERIVE
ncbi:30S ribosomal protein S2 [Candidatus Daviesbacteria bacterium]|nr:30S ribosomal protein S2 [Candidatus Daviesbacteria bacterium]